jgi:tetratricopeptide (TPR) repeat protein
MWARTIFAIMSFVATDGASTFAFPAEPAQDVPSSPTFRESPASNTTASVVAKHTHRAIHLAQEGKLAAAIEEISHAVDLAPTDFVPIYNRANFYLRLGEFTWAIPDLNTAIELNPNFALAFLNRGIAYSNLGQLDKALDDLNHAERLDPSASLVFYNFDLAIADFTTGLKIEPSDVPALLGRAVVYETLGNTDLARDDYRAAAAADPTNAAAAQALIRLGR